MKIRILFLLFCLSVIPSSLLAQDSERIPDFDVTIEVKSDASLLVTEKITVRSAGDRIRRGITRTIPVSYRGEKGRWIRGELEILFCLRDGKPENYHTNRSGDSVTIYFGNKKEFLKPGVYTYTLTYTITRQLGFFEEYDEVYWNVTGHDWAFPIDHARCEVRLPEGAHALEAMMYEGNVGATAKTAPDFNAGNVLRFSSKQGYMPRQGMTVAVSWPKGLVREASLLSSEVLRKPTTIFGISFLGLIFVHYLVAWMRVGKDPQKGPIIPRYEPPEGFSPAMCRVLWKKGFDARAFGASLVNMAVHGGLTIEEVGKKQRLLFSETGPDKVSKEEKAAWKVLAAAPPPLELASSSSTTLQKAMKEISRPLTKKLETYFKTNLKWFVPGFLLTFPMAFILSGMGSQTFGVMFMLSWLSIWSLACFALLIGVLRLFREGKFGRGLVMGLFALPFWAGLCSGFFMLYQVSSFIVFAVLCIAFVLHGLFLFLLRAPTPLGQVMTEQLEGFRLYLSVAEKDRLRLLYPEKETPELFEKFLPYAMALDLENEWGNRFGKILEQASYSPDWYRGPNFSTRSPARMASSLGKVVASAAPSGSSSRSGTRGGSSGGGRGGGGGGGW